MSNSVVDDILKQLRECQDPDQIKKLSYDLTDAMEFTGNKLKEKILEKWAKKLEPIYNNQDVFTEADLHVVAQMLENQYRYTKSPMFMDSVDEDREKIKILEEQANELGGEAKEILLKSIEEKKKTIPKDINDHFGMRGVNIQDEIVKFYDCLSTRHMIGIQPMMGPVGMAYALRFRGMTDGDEIGLTVENKELKARTRKLKLNNEKVSGPVVAKEVDREIAHRILGMSPTTEIVSTENLRSDILKYKDDIADKTKVGAANCILSNGKFITDDIEELFDHNIVMPELEDEDIAIGYSGERSNDSGLIYCPYIPFMFTKAMGKEEYCASGIMTRYGIMDKIYGSENYYQSFHVLDTTQEIVDNYKRFIRNTEKYITDDEKKKRILPLAMGIYKELSDNFKTLVPVVEKEVGTTKHALKARWSIEAHQELASMHNIDLEEEMMDLMMYEIVREIREAGNVELHSFGFELTLIDDSFAPRTGVYVKLKADADATMSDVDIVKKYSEYLKGMDTDAHVRNCARLLNNTEKANKDIGERELRIVSNTYKQLIGTTTKFVGIQVPLNINDEITTESLRFRKNEEDEYFLTKDDHTQKVMSRKFPVTRNFDGFNQEHLKDEIEDLISYELSSELQRYFFSEVHKVADTRPSTTWKYDNPILDMHGDNDGKIQQEIFKTLHTTIQHEADSIARETRRGAGNVLLSTPKPSVALTALGALEPYDDKSLMHTLSRYGNLNGIQCFRDASSVDSDSVLVAYKGKDEWDAGVIFGLQSFIFHDHGGISMNYVVDTAGAEGYYRKIEVDMNVK
jgi:hypothetical protein